MSPVTTSVLHRAATLLRRTNHAGRPVTLAEGALVVAGTSLLAARADARAAAALAGIGALGLVDDLLEPVQRRAGRPVSKGLRGHLGAVRGGHLTTGAAKALGIPALALVATATAPAPGGLVRSGADAALVAGCANLANLLDLRPGRALKVLLPAAAALAVLGAGACTETGAGTEAGAGARADGVGAGIDGAVLGRGAAARARSGAGLARAALVPGLLALPADLREHGMLGDAGANVLGAAVGAAATRLLPVPARGALLAAVVALTLASEKVSFSAVIDRTPVLHALDRWGRRPLPSAAEPAPEDAGDDPGAEQGR